MRKLFGGAAEDLCEPPNSFLMRYVHEVVVAKDVRQAVLAGVRLSCGTLRRPEVSPPSQQTPAQRKPRRQLLQKLLPKLFLTCLASLGAQVLRDAWVLTSNVKVARWLEHGESSTFNPSIAGAFQFGVHLR